MAEPRWSACLTACVTVRRSVMGTLTGDDVDRLAGDPDDASEHPQNGRYELPKAPTNRNYPE